MRLDRGLVAATLVALSMAATARAARAPEPPDPCAAIRQACEQAGFKAQGLTKRCLDPIVSGGEPGRAGGRLPHVSAEAVAACKASHGQAASAASGLPTPPIRPGRIPPVSEGAPRGIFVNASPKDTAGLATANQAISQVAGVDGMVLVMMWSEIEPGHDAYEWKGSGPHYLDDEIRLAMLHGKQVELNIRADSPPGWLPAGATGSFMEDNKGGIHGCHPDTVPIPWNATYLAEWDKMLKAVAAHLKGTLVNGRPEYDAVTILRLTGVNMDSDELHLPGQGPPLNKTPCLKDNPANWTNAGYTPAALLQGWTSLVGSFNASFHDKFFSVAIIDSTYPFPALPTDKAQGLSQRQNEPLLAAAHKLLGARLVIQNNSLYENEPARAETIAFAKQFQSSIAFQTNFDLGRTGGASCQRRQVANNACASAKDFLALLDRGIHPTTGMRAQYIEVFAPNVLAFPQAISSAHDELFSTAAPPGPGPRPCPHGARSCT